MLAELTELERTRLENYALRHSIMQNQIQQLIADRNVYLRKVEENHPGYKWDETRGGLVAEQPEDAGAKKPEG